MAAPLLLVGIVLFVLWLERMAELAINRRHVAWLRERGARFAGPDGFYAIVLTQGLLFVLLAAEAAYAPWTAVGWWTWLGLGLAVLAQALRYWVIATLGNRWSVRVVTLPGTPRILGGPYRFLRHPNYLAVVTEAVALPLAFLAWGTLAIVLPGTLLALARRIRVEDRALDEATRESGAHG